MKTRLVIVTSVLFFAGAVGVLGAAFFPDPLALPILAQSAAGDTLPVAADARNETSFFSQIFGGGAGDSGGSVSERIVEIVSRLFVAVILAGVLALRPRRNIGMFRRSLHVSQTEILLAVVAASLMMIVGDNAARAFGIFAAVSLVRFRTNIRDPKEITVLLISMALGLAAGVGRWELGVALCLFALALLWLLEHHESDRVFRPMELKVKTTDTDETQNVLKKIFERYHLEAEVRELDPPDKKKPTGSIVYYVNVPLNLSTDTLSEEIIASSTEHLEGIEWEQQKTQTDIYQ